jgi:hypothetical protein
VSIPLARYAAAEEARKASKTAVGMSTRRIDTSRTTISTDAAHGSNVDVRAGKSEG